MNLAAKLCLAALTLLSPASMLAQASEIPSAAAPPVSAQEEDKRGRILLDKMVAALGGEAWANRKSVLFRGHSAAFFRGQPTESVVDFWDFRQYGDASHPEVDRIEYTKKRDIVQIWTADNGYEITYKGNKPLPAEQVQDYLRRRSHSIEAIINVWLKQPGVMVLYEGTSMVERRMADKVTLLGTNNDAVTLELDYTTHLPLRRSFEWRNAQFKDHDEDQEQYDDYHLVQGLETPFTISRYRNGDLANQRYILSAEYGIALKPDAFDISLPLKKNK
jgi:hypothetical protein